MTHLTKFVPKRNIVFLEAPPINGGDIYPYNRATFNFCRHWGVQFGPTLVGEGHMWRDGFHVLHAHRHLLVKSVAAAALGVLPHAHFDLQRPPYGAFGPWIAPPGQGMALQLPSFGDVAVAAPFYFRHKNSATQASTFRPSDFPPLPRASATRPSNSNIRF